jgi:hypothetical protein
MTFYYMKQITVNCLSHSHLSLMMVYLANRTLASPLGLPWLLYMMQISIGSATELNHWKIYVYFVVRQNKLFHQKYLNKTAGLDLIEQTKMTEWIDWLNLAFKRLGMSLSWPEWITRQLLHNFQRLTKNWKIVNKNY